MMLAGIETIILAVVFAASAAVAYSGYQKAKKALKGAKEQGILFQSRSTAVPRRFVYGTFRVGGLEMYFTTTGDSNEFLHFFLIWAEGPCEEIEAIYFDGEEVTFDGNGDAVGDLAGFAHIEHRLGTTNQTAIANAVSEISEWFVSDKALGICYSWVRLKYDAEKYPNGAPSISAVIKGKNNLYDIASDGTAWSENALVCCHDYMVTVMGVTWGEINENTGVAGVNACSEPVALSTGGFQPRYTFNGVITTDEEPESVMDRFITAMAGHRVYQQGQWFVRPGVYYPPTFTIDKTMILSKVKASYSVRQWDRVNEITGIYTSPGNNWFPTDFLAWKELNFLTEDGGLRLPEDIDLPDVSSMGQSRRIAKIFLRRARYWRKVEFTAMLEAYECEAGQTVYFDFPEIDFHDTPMEVMKISFNLSRMELNFELKETNSDIYDWTASEDSMNGEPTDSIPTPTAPSAGFGSGVNGVAGGLNYTQI